jgi:hypothetical protein
MRPILTLILAASGIAFQTSPPKTPVTDTPAAAPLPEKSNMKTKGVISGLEGAGGREDGVMSFAEYQGGSLPLKPNKVTAYVNQKEIVPIQGETAVRDPGNGHQGSVVWQRRPNSSGIR